MMARAVWSIVKGLKDWNHLKFKFNLIKSLLQKNL